jgi:hypothetical protein
MDPSDTAAEAMWSTLRSLSSAREAADALARTTATWLIDVGSGGEVPHAAAWAVYETSVYEALQAQDAAGSGGSPALPGDEGAA